MHVLDLTASLSLILTANKVLQNFWLLYFLYYRSTCCWLFHVLNLNHVLFVGCFRSKNFILIPTSWMHTQFPTKTVQLPSCLPRFFPSRQPLGLWVKQREPWRPTTSTNQFFSFILLKGACVLLALHLAMLMTRFNISLYSPCLRESA